MKALHKFRAMSAAQRSVLIQAAFLLLAAKASLATLRLRRSRRILNEMQRWLPGNSGLSFEEILRLVDAASTRCFRGPACLPRALVAQHLLRRNGFEAQLCIGAARGSEGEFQAHAWLEVDRQIVFGGSHEDVRKYVPFTKVDELTV